MNTRPNILLTQPVHDDVRARLSAYADIDMNEGPAPWQPADITRRISRATAMMGFMTDTVDADMLRVAPHLKLVACALKGFDNFDVDACTKAGVWVSIVPDLLTAPTAELAVGLAISLARHVRIGDAYVRSGAFSGWRSHLFGIGLQDSVVAVIGQGLVGRAIVQRLQGFGCASILGVDPALPSTDSGVERCTLKAAMQLADYVFVAVPLTPDSRHLIGREQLKHARPGQLIINVGRGSVIDENAVLDALNDRHIGGYAADVFECEDWGLPDRPAAIAPALLAHPATLFTPHIGSAVQAVRLAIEHRAADNIIKVLLGKQPPDAINSPNRRVASPLSFQ